MVKLNLSTMSAQLTAYLREELLRERWSGLMPGRDALAMELGVSPKIVTLALTELEDEGLLKSQGPGRRRKIVHSYQPINRSLKIAIVLPDQNDTKLDFIVDLKYRLEEEGFHTSVLVSHFIRRTGVSKKLAGIVEKTSADAWLLMGASRDSLGWFSEQNIPTFALFGRRFSVPIAATGPDKDHGMRVATRRLLELGHRRIVLLAQSERRLPQPGWGERAYLEELEKGGVAISSYNLPDWEESAHGLRDRIESMFSITPPTAIIVDGPPLFLAVQQHVTRLGYQIPDDVSLVCTDGDHYFAWQSPTIAYLKWDRRPWVRHAIRWAKNVNRGKRDVQNHVTKCDFVERGTISPAKPSA